MRYLRQNTATIVTVGPFYDKTDGVTIETALTITNERVSFVVDANDGSAPTLVLDNVTGATSGTSNDLNYITNCDAGLMQLELSAANTNYVGRAMLSVTDAANHCPVFHEFTILPGQVYDSLILGTDLLDANASQVGGTSQTGRDIGASVLLSSGTGTGQVSLSSGTVTVGTNNDKTGYALSGTQTFNVTGNITGNLSGSVGSVTGAVGSVTGNVGGNVTGSVGSVTGSVGSVTGAVGSVTGNVGGNVVGSTGSISGVTFPANFADLAITVTTGRVTAGTVVDKSGYSISGTKTTLDALNDVSAADVNAQCDTAISDAALATAAELAKVPKSDGTATWNATALGSIQSECNDALAAYDPPTNAEMEARTIASASYATAANLAVVDGIVDDLKSGIIYGASATGTLSTTQATTNLTGYADDQLIGRVIVWLTGACEGEATDITDYANASGLLTFTALTTAPGNGDTFKIV